jgi:hypothetical protein
MLIKYSLSYPSVCFRHISLLLKLMPVLSLQHWQFFMAEK